jgi:hypothetical protein
MALPFYIYFDRNGLQDRLEKHGHVQNQGLTSPLAWAWDLDPVDLGSSRPHGGQGLTGFLLFDEVALYM